MTITEQYQQRFSGLQRLYGNTAYAILSDIHIAVVGLGGVGSWAVEALARSGVGSITLIDYDDVSASNVNRQLHALTDTFNKKKSAVLKARLLQINPELNCHVIDDYINKNNLREHLSPDKDYDYVIDAIDTIGTKAMMIHHCKRNKIPIITTGGAGGITDPTMIQVVDLRKTVNDALAAKVRSKLRTEFGFSKNLKRPFGVECVYSSQQKVYPKENGNVSNEKPGIHGVHLDCRFGYGSISFVTASFGFIAASRALNKTIKKRIAKLTK